MSTQLQTALEGPGITISDVNQEFRAALIQAAQLTTQEAEPLIPRGIAGACMGCNQPVASHFAPSEDGQHSRFLGCLRGQDKTVYVLVPVVNAEVRQRRGKSQPDVANDNGLQEATSKRSREFKVARYFSASHHKVKPEKLEVDGAPLAEVQLKVLNAIHNHYKLGMRSRDIIKAAKLSHGAVQSTLNWLRSKELVEAREDRKSLRNAWMARGKKPVKSAKAAA